MNTFLNPGDVLLTHAPTFDIYGLDAEVLGAEVVTVPDLDATAGTATDSLKNKRTAA